LKVAISTDGDVVSAHFGRCPSFTIVEIQDKQVVKTDTIANPGHHPGFLPQFLREKVLVLLLLEAWECGLRSYSYSLELKQ